MLQFLRKEWRKREESNNLAYKNFLFWKFIIYINKIIKFYAPECTKPNCLF